MQREAGLFPLLSRNEVLGSTDLFWWVCLALELRLTTKRVRSSLSFEIVTRSFVIDQLIQLGTKRIFPPKQNSIHFRRTLDHGWKILSECLSADGSIPRLRP